MVKVILSTVGDEAAATSIAETLVGERLVACVNVVPQVRSIYRWKGEVQRDAEVLMVIKTEAYRVPEVLERIKQVHPYEVPEMVVLDVNGGWGPYLDWVREETRQSES